MVSLQGAMAASQLAAGVNLLTQQIAQVNLAIANASFIQSGTFSIYDPTVGGVSGNFNIIPGGISPTESATIFNNMLTILQTRLNTLNAELAAVT